MKNRQKNLFSQTVEEKKSDLVDIGMSLEESCLSSEETEKVKPLFRGDRMSFQRDHWIWDTQML